MRLKSLEIYGFKSFGQRTVLEFPTNITIIVGPNGSGKSNIVDAIKWVLGEQGLKSIRISESKDIIFTSPQKALNLCWVKLNFNDEYLIERKLFRDGTNEYLLNGEPIKLKDLQLTLAKLKISPKGLNIVNQGSADIFFKSSPEQRYEMILELIGVKEYEFKKQEALKKIQQTKENITQIKVRLQELKPQLRFFQKEKEKAEKIEALNKEIEEIKEEIEIAKYFHHSRKIEELEKKLEDLKEEEEKVSQNLENYENLIKNKPESYQEELKELKNEEIKLLEEKNRILSQMVSKKYDEGNILDFVVSELRALLEINFLDQIKERIQKIISYIQESKSPKVDSEKIKEIDEKIKNIKEKTNQLLTIIKEKETERENIFYEFKELQYKYLKIQEEIKHTESALLFFKEEIKNLKKPNRMSFKDLEILENELRVKESLLSSLGQINEDALNEYKKINEKVEKLEKELFDFEKALANLNYFIIEVEKRIKNEFSKAMKSINENFSYYFSSIFAGGRAKLIWKSNLKAIDIFVQIPGKKITNFDSLSGGEKSLTSIALICALVKTTKPIFVVLDEVDASLDEVNAVKFSQLIKELSQTSQFIIISHNRATMEIAQSFYGVSMDSDNSSKVISLKLT